ncbi:sugar ABC transporter ATP-binding protein [Paraburkholderia rhizosphaerae]|uniref:Monosaccharide ABC transporter ATP-binding protein (CUT2 family) n=1 Tax=Paraburkholderia rhizosphaerae TaxID=480658 RepID=A0A4R8M3I8_9BURK|nr:sugar ABC transporter ATP-binding protein [Paraburkholderia rhizosphaerae]TDY54114.1 monosaccharide ABC transporter ATP-binding protein (CUT2 family) [Paraburkholderia rhizosphaerae]
MASGTVPLLAARGITKRFFGALALNDASFELRRGEIHALIGENGAGKSTFIKILAGVYQADGGEILLDGNAADPAGGALPIAFVHQDLALVDDLSVGENIALIAGYPRKGGLIDWAAVMRQVAPLYSTMNIEPPDPERLVITLSLAEKAVLGIVRSLAGKPRALVLDEPTAALPEADAQRLFEAIRRLRDAGTSIIYVSHRLNELFGLADRVTVFRDGRHVHTTEIAHTNPQRLIEQMLGRSIESVEIGRHDATRQPAVLRVDELVVEGRGPLSFDASPGEVVGLVGLRGGGQEAAGRAIFGALPADAGRIVLDGRELPRGDDIGARIRAGIVLLAGDRMRESTFPGMTLAENLFPNPLITSRGLWQPRASAIERQTVQARLEQFDVRPRNPASLIDWLSGGNQQKVCLARWLEARARVVILEEPTAGVDIGAKLSIHQMLRKAAADGAAVIVVSSDLEEVAAVCDRALVIDRGRVASEVAGDALTMDALIARSSLGERGTGAHG